MAYIKQIEEDEATGRLAQVYAAGRARAGSVAKIITVMSRDAKTAGSSMRLYIDLMKADNALPRPQKEMLAAVVSNINDCYY